MSKVLCITGMHRSGTSLTASWVQQCGLQIDDGKLIGAAIGNELGHFEDGEFVNLHSKYILRLWPSSKNWIVYRHRDIDAEVKQMFKAEAMRLIEARNKKYEFWGWKDPRTILFLDIWKELIPDLKCLLVWREARDVANSLTRRSRKATQRVYKIGSYRALQVWKYYNERMLHYYNQRSADCLVANIRNVIQNDRAVVQAIVEKLGLELRFTEIDSLIKENMLRRAPSGMYIDLLCRIHDIERVEKALKQISFEGYY